MSGPCPAPAFAQRFRAKTRVAPSDAWTCSLTGLSRRTSIRASPRAD